MKCKIRKLVCLAWMLAMTVVAYAQGNGSGWTVNEHDYQYQMSVYAKLVIDEQDVTDYSNYEVAAFVGNECRGVATVDSKNGYTWLWMFARSNSASGEKISFKIYDKTTEKEKRIAETIDFVSDGQIGEASSPTTFTLAKYNLGDVNDDGEIDISDVQELINLILYTDLEDSTPACDFNEDGEIDISDVQNLITYVLNN